MNAAGGTGSRVPNSSAIDNRTGGIRGGPTLAPKGIVSPIEVAGCPSPGGGCFCTATDFTRGVGSSFDISVIRLVSELYTPRISYRWGQEHPLQEGPRVPACFVG